MLKILEVLSCRNRKHADMSEQLLIIFTRNLYFPVFPSNDNFFLFSCRTPLWREREFIY